MRWVLMGRKPPAARALEHLLDRGHQVAFVVSSEETGAGALKEAARRRGVPVGGDQEVYDALAAGSLEGVDVVVSYLHRRKIRPALMQAPRLGCFNFHPAPLPELRGVGGYNFAILENRSEYGASLHWVAPEIDAGDLVWVRRFPIEAGRETAWSLEHKTQAVLWELFVEFVDRIEQGCPIPRTPQGEGRYISRSEMLAAMRIEPDDPPELVDRKARAFWFPPHPGAYFERAGQRFTVVPELGLRQVAEALGRNGGWS